MINADMRLYNFFTFGADNGYGQPALNPEVKGQVKMSINIFNQSNTDNIKYSQATYVGVTHDKNINDTYVIEYGNEKLKVLYVNPKGRYKIVYLGEI